MVSPCVVGPAGAAGPTAGVPVWPGYTERRRSLTSSAVPPRTEAECRAYCTERWVALMAAPREQLVVGVTKG